MIYPVRKSHSLRKDTLPTSLTMDSGRNIFSNGVYLINPPAIAFHARSSRWGGRKNRSGILAPPIYLATAAGYLNKLGVPAEVIDMCALRFGKLQIDKFLSNCNSEDLIIIEVSTPSINTDALLSQYIKENFNLQVVFVGSHVSALPEETLNNYPIDFVCIGEYEQTLYELYKALENKKDLSTVKGLGFKKGGRTYINPKRQLLNLDTIPRPAYEQLPVSKYYDPIAMNSPYMAIISSRGCPFKCRFCVEPQVMFENKVRYRDSFKVVDEIGFLVKSFRIKEIFFDDSTFTLNKRHVVSICDELIARNINIDWSCFARGDLLDRELLYKMKRSGCYMLRFGVESIDEQILKNMNKGLTFEDIKRGIILAEEFGLRIHLTVMFGFPGETEHSLNKTLNFVKSINADFAQFSIATPYPGTDFFNQMKKSKQIISYNWGDYDGTCKSVIKLKNMDSNKLPIYVEKAYRNFYFSPLYIIKRILKIKRLKELRYLFKSGYNLLRSQL